jgi:hypothetical protein
MWSSGLEVDWQENCLRVIWIPKLAVLMEQSEKPCGFRFNEAEGFATNRRKSSKPADRQVSETVTRPSSPLLPLKGARTCNRR